MADLEAELLATLAEQEEALAGVQQLLEADPHSEEMAALLADLKEGIQHTTDALLGLKRQRLLAELDAMQGGHAAPQQQQQQQQQEIEVGAASGGLPPGSLCIFRHTDGRHYFGRVLSSAGADGVLQLEFCFPTRAFHLEPLALPAAACQPAPAAALRPDAAALQPGARVIARPEGQQLWEAAELTQVDASGQQVAAVLVASRRRLVLPLAAVALSAHALDPRSSGSDDDRGGGSDDSASSDGGAGSGSEDGGSDMEESEEEEERAAGFGGAAFGRVSLAVADAAELQQAQAAAGPQSDTRLFFASESHSRGIGSKLLAKMGFKAGQGLGRSAQGLQQALMAAPLKRGAGLGVAGAGGTKEGAKKKRRSGKQRRRDKAAAAGAEARAAAREGQRRLEEQTGSVGLFAVLNSIVGDSSVAQAVRNERLGMGPGGGSAAAGGASRQGHLFAGSSGVKAAPKEDDRRALSKRADDLVQLRQKVQRLSDMAKRNAKDKVMLPQIRRALGEAQAALAAAEGAHAASSKAIADKEKLKRMHKF